MAFRFIRDDKNGGTTTTTNPDDALLDQQASGGARGGGFYNIGGTALAGLATQADKPGPVTTPNENQGGEPAPPRATPPPPPPIASSNMPNLGVSSATGGVQGSFAQAGTRGFNQRFGGNAPADWFRRDLVAATPQTQRNLVARRSGGVTGGSGASLPAAGQSTGVDIFGGEEGSAGGRPGDKEYQRFIAQVMQKLFSGGR